MDELNAPRQHVWWGAFTPITPTSTLLIMERFFVFLIKFHPIHKKIIAKM